MIRLNLTALFYSNKNIELAYKTKRICRELNINLINAVDFVDLTDKVRELTPPIVFFDLYTTNLKKDIIKLFVSKGEYYIPNIVFIYENKEDLKEYEGIDFYSVKVDKIASFLKENENKFKLNAVMHKKQKDNLYYMYSKINSSLFSMGFSPKHTGYSYLTEAIKLVLKNDGAVRSLNNEIYPFIAAKYGTTVSNVERNIRNTITCAFETFVKECKFKESEELVLFSMFKERPTNREFICMYIEYVNELFYKKNSKRLINGDLK